MSADYGEQVYYIVGIRLWGSLDSPDCCIVHFDDEVPVMKNGKILVFTSASEATDYCVETRVVSSPAQLAGGKDGFFCVVDVSSAIEQIEQAAEVEGSNVITLLNLLLDCLKQFDTTEKRHLLEWLEDFADFMTFNDKIAEYLTNRNLSPVELRNTVAWGLGTVAVHLARPY